jgi:hypothetical protein
MSVAEIRRVLVNERLNQVDFVEESVPNFEACPGRQCGKLIGSADVGDDLKTLVHKAHQQAVQPEEKLGVVL